MSALPFWKSAEIGLLHPFSGFFALFRRARRAPGKSRKREKRAFFLRFPRICFSYRAILVAIVSQNSFVLVFMGYRTIIAQYVAKRRIAQICLCKTKCQGGGIAPFWGSANLPEKVSRDMVYRSDSIAVSRDMGPLRVPARGFQIKISSSYIEIGSNQGSKKRRLLPPAEANLLNDFLVSKKNFQDGGRYKTPLKKKTGKPYLPPKSFLCGPHFFLQREVPSWSRVVHGFFFIANSGPRDRVRMVRGQSGSNRDGPTGPPEIIELIDHASTTFQKRGFNIHTLCATNLSNFLSPQPLNQSEGPLFLKILSKDTAQMSTDCVCKVPRKLQNKCVCVLP